MNILYWMDEIRKDFSRYLWVSILSLLENNKDENIHIYILSKYIEESNKKELIRIVEKYWKKISFSEWEITPEKFKSVLCLKWKRPIATYYRWFFLEKFNIKDRVLYLDCDTIVNKNLFEFYNSDFEWNVIIWHSEIWVVEYSQNKRFWLSSYINAGVYLINIDLYKEENLYKWVVMVNNKFWDVDYVDQDYTNIIFKGRIKLNRELQIVSCFFTFKDYYDYLIVHTTQKPNAWWYSYCPSNIELLFNWYLKQTKWKSYLWYKREISIRDYCNYVYNLIKNYCVFKSVDIFWEKFWVFLRNCFDWCWKCFGKILRMLKIYK